MTIAFVISELLSPGNHTSWRSNKSDFKGGTMTWGSSDKTVGFLPLCLTMLQPTGFIKSEGIWNHNLEEEK